MNKKFAFGFDPNKKITYTPKPIQKVEFGTKETAFNKPKAPQPKIEIPKATFSSTGTVEEEEEETDDQQPEFYITVYYIDETHECGMIKVDNNKTLGEIKEEFYNEILGKTDYNNYSINHISFEYNQEIY